MTTNEKTSLLVPSQLPSFIRDDPDYSKFVAFIQAYYEWLEQDNNVYDRSKNILNYVDVDKTTDQFIQYFINEFLPYFPQDALISKEKAIKIARQLYESKGTPASYKFLFRLLYNSDVDIFYTKDAVLKASAGKWYVSKSLKLSATDKKWLQAKNYRIFGETSKTFASIENVVITGNKVEVFISDIQRLFESGEVARVVDSNNQDVLFDGEILSAKIVGQIGQIRINSKYRGLFYETGDPVIVYGGLNTSTENPIGATATVGQTTSGSITNLSVVQKGFGYRLEPNTVVSFTNAPGASAYVAGIDPDAANVANVTFAVKDSIGLKQGVVIGANNYNFSNNMVANANTSFANAFTFATFTTYPISSVLVTNGGGGIKQQPRVSVTSIYVDENDNQTDLKNIGILAPIQILDGASGYKANDTIIISGGTGYGAYARVKTVNSTGAITSTQYVYGPSGAVYPLGGMGYKSTFLPTLTVQSANTHTSNAAVLTVPTILGDGATFAITADRTGSITTINIENFGEDYVSAPKVSLRVEDIAVANLSQFLLPDNGDIAYQGNSYEEATYTANVYSTSVLQGNGNPLQTLYAIRVFNYSTLPNPLLPIKIKDKPEIVGVISNQDYPANAFFPNSVEFTKGIKTYGDGAARATATFLNGLTIGQGQYLTAQGQPSSYDVLQNDVYNNYTYQITVEKEIAKYRDILLNLLHPTGTKVIGRYVLKSSNNYTSSVTHALQQGHTLQFHTGYSGSTAKMVGDFTNKSNNIVELVELGAGVDIKSFIFAGLIGVSNTIIELVSPHGPNVRSEVLSVDSVSNTLTLKESTWLTWSNVAMVQANSGGTTIDVKYLTNSYDLINGGVYTDPQYPLKDILVVGDKVKFDDNPINTVTDVDYGNNTITVANSINTTVTSYLSVNRNIYTTQVKLYGATGVQYIPQLTTEDGQILTDESGNILIIG